MDNVGLPELPNKLKKHGCWKGRISYNLYHFILKPRAFLLKRSGKLITNVCGLIFSYFPNRVCERHIKASADFEARILADIAHPFMNNYQRQWNTPPPGAVSSCFPRRLMLIGTLLYRQCHGSWLAETLNWITTHRSFLDAYPPPPPLPHFPTRTTSLVFTFKSLSKKKKKLRILLSKKKYSNYYCYTVPHVCTVNCVTYSESEQPTEQPPSPDGHQTQGTK